MSSGNACFGMSLDVSLVYFHLISCFRPLNRTLFSLDIVVSALTGRPCSLHEEEYVPCVHLFHIIDTSVSYDQEYPVGCNDEDWEHPDPLGRLQQPSHEPTGTPYFICYIRLMEILAKIMRY